MDDNLREYYKALYFTDFNSSPHDYGYSGKLSGAMYAIGEIKDAVPIIHGSAGCGFHYKYVCRRGYLPAYNAQCTQLEEEDIIFGGEEKLRAAIIKTVEKYSPSMIAVIPATSVDMTCAEVDSVIKSLRNTINCKLIAVNSEKFSHVDKRNRGRAIEDSIKNWGGSCRENTFEFSKGCGFSEAMTAIVENLMTRQEPREKSVNICGFAWGAGGSAIVDGMARELKALDIEVNAFIPNCTTQELITAPSAALNIVTRRIPWARRMKELYGTEYFQAGTFENYRGISGIERLYLEISQALCLEKSASQSLVSRKNQIYRELGEVRTYFDKFTFALVSSDYRSLPYYIEEYEREYGIRLKYVCVRMKEEDMVFDGISKETKELLMKNIRLALLNSGSKALLLQETTDEELLEVSGAVDFVLGDQIPDFPVQAHKFLRGTGKVIPMDMAGYGNMIKGFAAIIRKRSGTDRQNRDEAFCLPEYYSGVESLNLKGSRKMWEELWLQRRYGT